MTAYKNVADKDDADFQSLRYVLGEMPVEEAHAFEENLANDQEARELVAQSTGLVIDLLAHPSARAERAAARVEVAKSHGAARRFGSGASPDWPQRFAAVWRLGFS